MARSYGVAEFSGGVIADIALLSTSRDTHHGGYVTRGNIVAKVRFITLILRSDKIESEEKKRMKFIEKKYRLFIIISSKSKFRLRGDPGCKRRHGLQIAMINQMAQL